jgi:phosphoglycerate dehydrogenase-like enzyme
MRPLPIAIAPARPDHLVAAITAGGGQVADVADAEALVWTDPDDPSGLAKVLDAQPNLVWVQLPWAGIEPYVDVVREHPETMWASGKGVYAEPVAEHALALALAGRRCLDRFARTRTWTDPRGNNLLSAAVTIVGGGGITESLLRMLGPFGCDVTVVRPTPRSMAGANRVVPPENLDEALQGADVVVLALALLPETEGLMNRHRLGLLGPESVLVNVARGAHVVTDDLVAALDAGDVGSAGLDVTDPEPLPDGHPLWDRPNVIITPHTANTPEMAAPLLAERVTENVRRFVRGELIIGAVDPAKGY